jgi:hypothetical protein
VSGADRLAEGNHRRRRDLGFGPLQRAEARTPGVVSGRSAVLFERQRFRKAARSACASRRLVEVAAFDRFVLARTDANALAARSAGLGGARRRTRRTGR